MIPHRPSQLPKPTRQLAWPFLVVGAAGMLSMLAPPIVADPLQLGAVMTLFVLDVVLLLWTLRRSQRSPVDAVPAYFFFVIFALARDINGGSTSGLAPLVLLPVLWLALTGTRRDMVVSAVMTAAVFLLPILVVGGAAYPVSDWRRALLWTLVALLIAPVVHRLVSRLASETRRVEEAAAEMDGIMRGARLTSMISTDLNGTIRSFNSGAEDLLGYPESAVVGHASPELFHDPVEVATAARELSVEPGFAVFAELAGAPSRTWTYLRSDGTPRFVRLAITELRDSTRELVGYLGVAVDMTVAVEAERRLIQAEARWRLLVEHLPDTTVVMVDEHHNIRLVAGAGAMRQGLRGSEGRPLSDVSTRPDNIRLLTRMLDDAFDGVATTAEMAASATGDEHEVFVTRLPHVDTDGQAMILARDVSAERSRERALVRANVRSERLFEDAPHGILVMERDGRVTRANTALGKLIGADPRTLVDQSLELVLDALDPSTIADHLARVVEADGVPVEVDVERRETDGAPRHWVLSSRLLTADDEHPDVLLVNVLDVSERRKYEARLEHMAHHDALTGLLNRRAFDEELQRHLARCDRYGPTGALLLLDLDHFKQVNDTLGHSAGDELLIDVAALLRRGLRETDIVARLGGDEFAVLLPEADHRETESVADMVVKRIRDHAATLDGVPKRVTASVGAVTFQAASEHDIDILALADMTMYDAKEAGRDQSSALPDDSSVIPRSGARMQWQARLEAALAGEGFELHLQPIISVSTGQVTGAEALLRLRVDGRLFGPAHFLNVAERVGLMPEVDAWVVRHTIPMLARLREMHPGFLLEVNLSGHSIGHPDIEETIRSTLVRHDVDPSALVLEITETAAVADVAVARGFAQRMTDLGCKFALDDFGAGFGSFYYLKHLIFDYVKIDGEFISHCHTSEVDRTILRSIVGIARDLGKRTVAEFVADEEIERVVRAEGVDFMQGYLHGMPVPEKDFVRLLQQRTSNTPS